MQRDIFVSSDSKNNMFPEAQKEEIEDNFFLQLEPNPESAKTIPAQRHLNDYDMNILKEDAYKDIDDDVFRLEYKISKTEEYIAELDKKIEAAKEIRDFDMAEVLFEKRKKISSNLDYLTRVYNNASLSAKISGGIATNIKSGFDRFKKRVFDIVEDTVFKFPGKLSSILELKSSLDKLENINKSVGELMSMQIPYGEANSRYDKLSKYIVKANSIQTEISKLIK